jgi:DNA-binding MarR family transcriptional regulator
MPYDDLLNISADPVYQELVSEYPGSSSEAIKTILQFMKLANFINLRRESMFSAFGLTSGRFHLLMLLKREASLTLSPTELAKRTGVTRGTMTQFIDAIEKDGFVKRVEDAKDRRGMLVSLTSFGEEKLKSILPTYIRQLEYFTLVLSPEERSILQVIMEKIVSSLRKENVPES